jgi:hypothetical protein
VQANILTETGMRLAVLDSAATNVWFDEETFAECNGRDIEPATRDAGGANGSALDVVRTGVMRFSLRRQLTRNKRVVRCYALLWMRPLSISCAEVFVVISCGKVDYDKSGWSDD